MKYKILYKEIYMGYWKFKLIDESNKIKYFLTKNPKNIELFLKNEL